MCNISNNKKDNKNKKINPKIIKGIIVLILIISFGAVFDFNLVKINTKSLLGVDSVTVSTKNNQHSNSTNNGSNIISEVVNITNNSIGNTVGDGFDNKNKNKDMGDVYGEGKALISSKDNYNGSVSLGGNRKIKLTDDSVFFDLVKYDKHINYYIHVGNDKIVCSFINNRPKEECIITRSNYSIRFIEASESNLLEFSVSYE